MSVHVASGGRLTRALDRVDGVAITCAALAGALAALAWIGGWAGPDLAAQLHRIDVFRTFGFTLWDAEWFGGHYPLAYSVLFAPLGALLGAGLLGALCAAGSAWAFARLLRVHFGSQVWLGGLWFAAGTVATVMIGQLAFLLGAVVALLVVLAHGSGRRLLAGILAVLCPLASPVAGALLLLVIAAWWLSTSGLDRRALVVLAALVCCGLAAVRLGFPQGGTFPVRGHHVRRRGGLEHPRCLAASEEGAGPAHRRRPLWPGRPGPVRRPPAHGSQPGPPRHRRRRSDRRHRALAPAPVAARRRGHPPPALAVGAGGGRRRRPGTRTPPA